MNEELNIQWFPGHMAKARRMITESARMVDAVCEVIDARIPASSRNPELDSMVGNKPRMIILNRIDLADPEATHRWSAYFKASGAAVLETDCKSGKGTNAFQSAIRSLLRERLVMYASRGQVGKSLRVMIVGIPNVGKSSLINRLAKRKAAEASDRPGVTRGKQWIKLGSEIELLDTPGLLWPKFEDRTIGENLAFTGAVKDQIIDTETLAAHLMERLRLRCPKCIEARYKFIPEEDMNGFQMLETAARKRGFLVSGGGLDFERMAAVLLDEFRGGKLGRITLEVPLEG